MAKCGRFWLSWRKRKIWYPARLAAFSEGYKGFRHQIPMLVFLLCCAALAVLAVRKRLSLLPTLGLLINLYLMTQPGINNWTMFFVWLLLGLGIYFGYGYRNSRLGRA